MSNRRLLIGSYNQDPDITDDTTGWEINSDNVLVMKCKANTEIANSRSIELLIPLSFIADGSGASTSDISDIIRNMKVELHTSLLYPDTGASSTNILSFKKDKDDNGVLQYIKLFINGRNPAEGRYQSILNGEILSNSFSIDEGTISGSGEYQIYIKQFDYIESMNSISTSFVYEHISEYSPKYEYKTVKLPNDDDIYRYVKINLMVHGNTTAGPYFYERDLGLSTVQLWPIQYGNNKITPVLYRNSSYAEFEKIGFYNSTTKKIYISKEGEDVISLNGYVELYG